MSFLENAGLKLLRFSEPEFAHNFAIRALNFGLPAKRETLVFENLKTSICSQVYMLLMDSKCKIWFTILNTDSTHK